MKKYFYSVLAAGMLFACSQEEIVDVTKGEGQQVTFKVELPSVGQSRAIAEGIEVGAGKYADKLVYAMYEEDQNDILVSGFAYDNDKNGIFEVNVPMAKDIKYDILFLAYNEDKSAFVINNSDAKANNLKALKMKSELSANQETYDAFIGRLDSKGVDAAASTTVELYRPFAQVNAATTPEDLATAKILKAEVASSEFVIYNAPNTLNVFTGAVSGTETFTYEQSGILEKYDATAYPLNETITVDGNAYYYLSMAYVLAGKNSNTYDADFSFFRNDDKLVSSLSVKSMPVQANYRTNILGTLLTQEENYSIVIDAEFGEPANVPSEEQTQKVVVATAAELKAAIADAEPSVGQNRAIGHDIKYTLIELQPGTYTGAFDVIGKNVILMSNDKENTIIDGLVHGLDRSHIVLRNLTLTNATPASSASDRHNADGYCLGSYVVNWVIENCTFNVSAGTPGAINVYSNLNDFTTSTIEGVNYDLVIKNSTFNCNGERPIRGKTNSYIEGCTFNNQHRYAIQVQGNEQLTDPETVTFINNKIVNPCQTSGEAFAAAVSISKSQLLENVTFNISGNTIESSVFELKNLVYDNHANVLITTCTLNGAPIYDYNCQKVDEETNEVVFGDLMYAGNTYYVANAAGLVELSGKAIKAGESVKLLADINLEGVEFNGLSAFNSENNNTFDGQNCTVSNWTNNNGASDMGFFKSWVGSIKNIKFENCHLKTNGRSAIVAANTYTNIDNISINNCSIEDSYWACGIIAGLYNSGSISNCTVTNSSVKSNGGTGGIVGVFNEEGGTRGLNNCSVSNSTINNTGVYGATYSGGGLIGMFYCDATFVIENCQVSNNTLEGQYIYEKYPCAAKIGDKEYLDFYEAVKAAKAGDEIVLVEDAELAFTDNPQYNNIYASTINLNGKTLTIKEGDIRFDETTIKNGNIVVAPGAYTGTAVFLMYDKDLTLNDVHIEATGVTGTYLIGLEGTSNLNMVDSEINMNNESLIKLTAVVCSNGSGLATVENSKVYVKNINGRAFLNSNCKVNNSDIDATYVKAGFYIPSGKSLSIEGNSTVDISNLVDGKVNGIDLYGTATYTVAETATVNSTVGRN